LYALRTGLLRSEYYYLHLITPRAVGGTPGLAGQDSFRNDVSVHSISKKATLRHAL
jgi:hypothetical protein